MQENDIPSMFQPPCRARENAKTPKSTLGTGDTKTRKGGPCVL
jgi:hypothetical protein